MERALLIVDLQNDFLPGGALPAPQGRKIIPVINELLPRFDLVVASKDWHPEKTVHFNKWPVHCVHDTMGAAFPEELDNRHIELEIFKGTNDSDDGYSAFEATNINLKEYLQNKDVNELYVVGIATEYCVKNSVLDSLKAGFKTFVIIDGVAGVCAAPGDEDKAWQEMTEAGATLIYSDNL